MTPRKFDHVRSRNRVAVVFLVSLAVFVPALVVPRSAENLALRTMVLTISLAATLISGVWLMVRWDEAKRLLRLRAGQGVLARWTIDAARWAWFRHHSHQWDQRAGVRPNDVDFSQDPGSGGIEIVVARDGILIGEHFHPLELDARITVRADWMEFDQVIPKADGPALHTVLRIPLQPGRESLATDVAQAYQRVYRAAPSARRSLIYMALGIFIGLPAVTALAWFIAWVTGWVE